MTERITSLQNPRIKNILHLSKANERRKQDLIVIEGFREIMMALQSGLEIRELYVAPEVNTNPDTQGLIAALPQDCSLFEISKPVFEKVAYRDNSDGLIALAKPKSLGLQDLKLSDNPLVIVMESPEKPGNIGAILRSADAAALDAVIICDPKTDLYNSNVIRASLGCIFSCQIASCTSLEAIEYLRDRGIRTFAAALTAQKYYYEADFTGPAAIVMGSEADGLTQLWMDHADMQIKIPMGGRVDSLNLSTSAAVLIFDAKRQRDCFKG
jgi:TrmH family RNA methyltransferase